MMVDKDLYLRRRTSDAMSGDSDAIAFLDIFLQVLLLLLLLLPLLPRPRRAYRAPRRR
jgi:hypothetical protein